MEMEGGFQKELFSSLISNIKNYKGEDPLRPWLHGIRKMRESLPPQILKEKLPRFLQKCAQTFESDRRYRNDSRYLRVWIQLMDYVDDPRVLLRKMENNRIGLKRAMFYLAYALYYEKRKKFEDAEKMYHMGVENLAEPVDELQKSYEQFLHRMKLIKKRKAKLQEAMPNSGRSSSTCQQGKSKITENKVEEGGDSEISLYNINSGDHRKNIEHIKVIEGCSKFIGRCKGSNIKNSDFKTCPPIPAKDDLGSTAVKEFFDHRGDTDVGLGKRSPFCSDDTVVVKFVGSAIVGKSEAEDACHHGLVDPTINMKEAMNAISSMFREPLEPDPMARRRSHQSKTKAYPQSSGFEVFVDESLGKGVHPNHHKQVNTQSNGFEVFVDESLGKGVHPNHNKQVNPQSNGLELFVDEISDEGVHPNHHKLVNTNSPKQQMVTELQKPFVGVFKIWADDDDDEDGDNDDDGVENKVHKEGIKQQPVNDMVCSKPNGLINSSSSDETIAISSEDVRLKEDSVIRRFVGTTVFDESEVENACHHGLVDPTVNLKDAMDDINSMFGKPLNFVKANKPKKQSKLLSQKPVSHMFCILADDYPEEDLRGQTSTRASCMLGGEDDLFEPTVFTREAMAEINEMFGKPLDF